MSLLKNPNDFAAPGWNGQLPLSAKDARELRRLLSLLGNVRGLDVGQTPEMPGRSEDADAWVCQAASIIESRQRRKEVFPERMFGEPAWEALLMLYHADGRVTLTVKDLVNGSGCAQATMTRWLHYLEEEGYISSRGSHADRRIRIIALTDKGRRSLDQYFKDGLSLVSE